MPEVRKRVGRYDLLEVIGRGGAAVVYLARQRDLQRHVALKELAPYYAADSSFAERFVQESYLAGSMSHANVVTVHEYFEDDAVPYIAMEYLPHGSLRQYVGKLSTPQIAGVLEGVLAGLSHGEVHGIVHRDLKPENLLVAADGRVKIADFGVARAYNRAATRAVVTSTGTTIGTPAYMSPEQALGGTLTPATDLYSLGVVAWELFAGQVPFEETDTPVAVLYRHVHEPVPSVRTIAPDVDARIADWLDRLLAKRPEDRFQSADAAWLELEDVVLDLAGPRWRREARLVVDDRAPASERALTPAEFDGADPVTPAPPKWQPKPPVAETVTDLEPQPKPPEPPEPPELPEPPNTTIAPKRRPQPRHTTMLRRARRHPNDDQSTAPPAPDVTRRRLTVATIVVAMAAAAVAGVLLANPGASHHSKKPPSNPAAATDRQLASIVQDLGTARKQARAQLASAGTPRGQAQAAARVQSAYAAAATRVAQLAPKSPAATQLHATLAATATAYQTLAAAARADSKKRWNDAWTAINRDESLLQTEVGKL
jgi:serine/threonine protein kinase